MEEDKFGTFIFDGQIIDVDNANIEKLEKLNKELDNKEMDTRNEINDILSSILV